MAGENKPSLKGRGVVGHGSPLFLKLYLARYVFLEIAFVSFPKASKTFFSLAFPESR